MRIQPARAISWSIVDSTTIFGTSVDWDYVWEPGGGGFRRLRL